MLLSDSEITKQSNMIAPHVPYLISNENGNRVISYGVSSHGYDIRLSPKRFLIAQATYTTIDPKRFDPEHYQEIPLQTDPKTGEQYFVMPPRSYGLGVALEKLDLPSDMTVVCLGKSTYCRTGIICNVSPGESDWRGHLTLEFANGMPSPCRLYANEGIVQLLFFKGKPCEIGYAQRRGKYQDQPEDVVFAKA